MIKYLVKKHCEATERCTVALGRVQDYYYGDTSRFLSRDFLPSEEATRIYGYASEDAALERANGMTKAAEMEQSSGYWIITVEVVSVEV